jgi:hypothetical protein
LQIQELEAAAEDYDPDKEQQYEEEHQARVEEQQYEEEVQEEVQEQVQEDVPLPSVQKPPGLPPKPKGPRVLPGSAPPKQNQVLVLAPSISHTPFA